MHAVEFLFQTVLEVAHPNHLRKWRWDIYVGTKLKSHTMGCSSLGPSPTLGSSFSPFLNKSTFILRPPPRFLRSYDPFQWNFIYFCSLGMKPRTSNVQGKSFTVESPPPDPVKLCFVYLFLLLVFAWRWTCKGQRTIFLLLHGFWGTELRWLPAF